MAVELESRPGGSRPGSSRSGGRRRMPRARRNFRAEAGLVVLALALLVAGLGFGAQYRPVLLLSCALSVAAASLSPSGLPMSRLALGLLGLAGFTAIQVLPLPFGLVQLLSPGSAEAWAGALHPFREAAPAWVSLSVDPGATWIEVLKLSSYACLAVAAAGLRARRGSASVAALVFVASSAVCLVTLAHGLVKAPLIYGLYPPPMDAERWTRGPFINGNNLAAYLNVGLFAGAGLWLGGRSPLPPVVSAVGVPVLAAGVVLGGSRGGVVALAVAGAFLVAIVRSQRTISTPRVATGALVVLLVALSSLFVLGDTGLWQSLFDTALRGKLMGFRWTLPMIRDFPVFGVGRGAFETAFQPYRGAVGDASTVYAHAENLVLDWTSEWGVPVGALALLGFGAVSALLISRGRKDLTLSGLAAGVVAVLVGGMVDFGLEIFGIGALVVVVLATAGSGNGAAAAPRPWLRFVPALASVLAATIVLGTGADLVQLERKVVRARAALVGTSAGPSFDGLRRELRAVTLRHPGDAYFPLVGAYLASRRRENPLPWLGRALERNPRSGLAHLALGEALGRAHKPSQALIHLRLAAAYNYALSDRALSRAAELEPNVEKLASAFPPEVVGGSGFADLCPKVPHSGRIACFREALRRDGRDREVQEAFALELLDALESKREPCVGAGVAVCESEVQHSSELLGVGTGYRGLVIAARVMARKGDRVRAVASLLGGCPATPSAAACLELAVELASKLPDAELASRAEQRFVALACEIPARCAAAHTFVADKREAGGDLPAALQHLTEAAREAPTAARWLKVADMAGRAGKATAKDAALLEAKALGALGARQQRELERLEGDGEGLLPP